MPGRLPSEGLEYRCHLVERYDYDPFGIPSIYASDGTPRSQSAYGNTRLYTGRQWLPALGLYDFRQRLYNPHTGRFLSTDPADDPANLGNPYTYVGNNPYGFLDPYGEERWGAQSYLADVADVGYGYFLSGIVDTASATWDLRHYSVGGYFGDLASGAGIVASGVASVVGSLRSDPLGATGRGVSGFYAQFEDSDTAGQATFAVASLAAAPIASTGVAAPAASAISKLGVVARGTAIADAVAEAGLSGQAAIRAKVIANVEASKAASAVGKFDVHLATEEIYANASKAVTAAKEAGLTNKYGALGMGAHKEFAELNAVTRERLNGRRIWIEVEPYIVTSGRLVERSTNGSLSVDALLQYRGANVRGFDLKTGRPWSSAGLQDRTDRFGVSIQQIQR